MAYRPQYPVVKFVLCMRLQPNIGELFKVDIVEHRHLYCLREGVVASQLFFREVWKITTYNIARTLAHVPKCQYLVTHVSQRVSLRLALVFLGVLQLCVFLLLFNGSSNLNLAVLWLLSRRTAASLTHRGAVGLCNVFTE